jgi:hypothetical protein
MSTLWISGLAADLLAEMSYRLGTLFALAVAITGVASGAATPVSPLPGARVTTSSPKFSWTLPSNEQAKGVFISDSPDVTPAGGFFDEDVVAAANFVSDERQWSPSSPLYAGHYWWSVWSSDLATSHDRFSTPIDFTIPVALAVLPVKTVRSTYLHLLAFKVRWRANVPTVLLRLQLLRRHRVIWRQTETDPNVLGSLGAKSVGWYRPKGMKRGARLTLQVILRAKGVRKTRQLVVRAP